MQDFDTRKGVDNKISSRVRSIKNHAKGADLRISKDCLKKLTKNAPNLHLEAISDIHIILFGR